jgi:hypothetical protein
MKERTQDLRDNWVAVRRVENLVELQKGTQGGVAYTSVEAPGGGLASTPQCG